MPPDGSTNSVDGLWNYDPYGMATCFTNGTTVYYCDSNFATNTYDVPAGKTLREIRELFWKHCAQLMPANLTPNFLAIVARAVNRVRGVRVIHQPRWRAGRWRSNT